MIKCNLKKVISLMTSVMILFCFSSGYLSNNSLTASAICCRKDGFDKSRYTLTGNMAQDVATIAKSQAGRTCSQFGYSGVDYGAWCDEYVADCLENAGCDDSIVAHGGTVADFENIMKRKGAVVVSSPQPGDLIFFSWSHVEIVTRVENGTVYCAGGNNQGKTYPGGRCAGERNAQSVAKSMNGSIRLYLRPNYKDVPSVPKGYVMSESEGVGQTIPDGDYWILSALSRNFWVDIPGDEISKNGENVTTYIREVNEVPSKYDAWTVTYLNNGYYKIKQKDTDLCLDVADASLHAGTNVQIVNDNGALAQQWSIIPTQTGYKLQSRCNSFVLDVTNGIIENSTNIMVWESNEQRTQRFGFIPYGTDEDRVVKDGTYQINSKVSDAYCIDASGEGAKNEYHNGTDIHLWTNDSDDVFKITYAGDGYYKIQEVVSGLYVEVINAGNILDTQTNVQLYEGNNSLGQYWKIRKNSNGSYTFVSKLSGYNLDLEDGKATQGQNISQHFNNDSTAQQWILKNTDNDVEGDCNNDGQFSVADVVILQKWLFDDETELINWQSADLDEDGTINVFDLCLMKQKLINK